MSFVFFGSAELSHVASSIQTRVSDVLKIGYLRAADYQTDLSTTEAFDGLEAFKAFARYGRRLRWSFLKFVRAYTYKLTAEIS